jgi:UDP-glucuronate 4-epimerase
VDDIVAGICGCIFSDTLARYELFNIGNHRSEKLMDMIALIAKELGIANPKMELLPMQDGDVPATYASVDKLHAAVGYQPTTPISVGIPKFITWFKEWNREKI